MFYYTAALTTGEMNILSGGSEVTKTATIGGLTSFGLSETLSVKFRQCGSDLHAYLVPSSISYSAYCVRKSLKIHFNRYFSDVLLRPVLFDESTCLTTSFWKTSNLNRAHRERNSSIFPKKQKSCVTWRYWLFIKNSPCCNIFNPPKTLTVNRLFDLITSANFSDIKNVIMYVCLYLVCSRLDGF